MCLFKKGAVKDIFFQSRQIKKYGCLTTRLQMQQGSLFVLEGSRRRLIFVRNCFRIFTLKIILIKI